MMENNLSNTATFISWLFAVSRTKLLLKHFVGFISCIPIPILPKMLCWNMSERTPRCQTATSYIFLTRFTVLVRIICKPLEPDL